MIPADVVTAWGVNHPWSTRAQVEQDLLLSRAICAIADDEYLSAELVFRGGTALHKLHLPRAWRYSEDLDYVRSSGTGIATLTRALTDLGKTLGFTVRTRVTEHLVKPGELGAAELTQPAEGFATLFGHLSQVRVDVRSRALHVGSLAGSVDG